MLLYNTIAVLTIIFNIIGYFFILWLNKKGYFRS